MEKVIIVRYSEIALKGKNRAKFENVLLNDIASRFKDAKVKKGQARIYVYHQEPESLIKKLFYVPGIKSYSLAYEVEKNLNSIVEAINKIIQENELKEVSFEVKRADKSFPMTSIEIRNELNKIFNAKREKPIIGVDLRFKAAYVYYKKHQGLGGLPLGSSGKGLLLLSGGLDSPVAGVLAIKRGLSVDAVHFDVYNDENYRNKVIEIYNELKKFNPKMKLFIVPFWKYHQYVYDKIKNKRIQKYGCVLCKRGMYQIAKKLNYKIMISGDNLGQVASQTIENMLTITPNDILVIRPLITYDKDEIVKLSEYFRIYDKINIKASVHCVLLPKNPATKSKKEVIERIENQLNINSILEEILKEIKIME